MSTKYLGKQYLKPGNDFIVAVEHAVNGREEAFRAQPLLHQSQQGSGIVNQGIDSFYFVYLLRYTHMIIQDAREYGYIAILSHHPFSGVTVSRHCLGTLVVEKKLVRRRSANGPVDDLCLQMTRLLVQPFGS